MSFRKTLIYIIGTYLVMSSIMSVSYFVGKQSEKSEQILNGITKKIIELIVSPIRITRRFFIHKDDSKIKNKTFPMSTSLIKLSNPFFLMRGFLI